jgi:ASPIC and UnbV
MSLFIANDMSANHYYHYDGGEQRLVESAALRGVALDGRAMTHASMGIAASDFDHDGDLDLYVTGFAREYNIYYEQVSPGFWRDETSRLKLIEPTLMAVGFGTQAIDLDNDGVDEIAVTNGHIGEFGDPNDPPYKQPFQVFRRDQEGAFELMDDDVWCEYLRNSHVGRAMWTMDVNRDGLRDLLVTHTFEPICLLVNQTKSDAHRVSFRLVATTSSRDAIGAIVRFECAGKSRALWMLSGDGYLCSSEKALHAGLGDAVEISNVTVTWPNGRVDILGSLEADREYLVVEGMDEPFAYANSN